MTKRRGETWTFQPDDDVVKAFNSIFGEDVSRGQRTQFINEALRLTSPEIAMASAEREVAEANERLKRMRGMVEELKRRAKIKEPVSDALGMAVEGSSAALRLAQVSETKQKAESPSENKPSRAVGARRRSNG